MSNGISKILVATDGSESSLHAAKFAGDLAADTSAELTVLTVHDSQILNLHLMGSGVWPGTVPDASLTLDEIKMGAEKFAAETVIPDTINELTNKRGVEVVQLWGHIAEAICDYASDEKFDLLVLGSRGQSRFERLLLGSISSQVVHHAPCPVTVVH